MTKEKSTTIVTFYSYKGGVGRSMALANAAWLLATRYNKNVLVVDWDLEAPGLHRFFDIKSEDITAGLIDLLYDYKDLLREEIATPPKELIDINKYLKKIQIRRKTISVMAAGRQDVDYAKKVNEFSWGEFYEKWEGYAFIEYLKGRFKETADFVLLDSRTGITDVGGICTLQLPDIVVLLFALNEQNVDGVDKIIQGIENRANEVRVGNDPPKLIILPSRVEKYLEEDKRIFWEEEAARRLGKYIQRTEKEEPKKYIKQRSIPYIGAYSFGETPLAAEKDFFGVLGQSFDYLTKSIMNTAHVPYDLEEEESPADVPFLYPFAIGFIGIIFSLSIAANYILAAGIWRFEIDSRLILLSLFSGGIGGCLRLMRTIATNIGGFKTSGAKRLLRLCLQPFIAMTFAALFHFLLRTSFGLEMTASSTLYSSIAVSGFIGLFSPEILDRLRAIFRVLLSEDDVKTNTNEKSS